MPSSPPNNAIEQHILGASWVVPVDPETDDWLEDYGLLIEDGCIRAIDQYALLTQKHPETSAEFFNNHILLPGLINCHGHAGMSLLRGFADDQPLQQWLEQSIWPQESRWVSDDFVQAGSALSIAEMLLSGTTTFSDMYFFPAATASVAQQAGIRAQINFPIIEFANNWAADADQHIALGLEVSDQYKDHDRIEIGFAPHAPYTVSDNTFSRVVMLAEEVDARIQVHLQETAREVADSIAEFGKTPVERLHELNVLSERTQAVHLTQFNQRDIELLQTTATSIVHCPASNLKLASGYCDVNRLLDNELTVGLGTDSAASNNCLSTFDSLRQAALLAKHHNQKANTLSAQQTLHLATLGAAKALGIDSITGSITLGKQADLIAINCDTPALQPVHNPVSQLVYTDCSHAVNHLWVSGQQLVKNRELATLDKNEILEKAKLWQKKLQDNRSQ